MSIDDCTPVWVCECCYLAHHYPDVECDSCNHSKPLLGALDPDADYSDWTYDWSDPMSAEWIEKWGDGKREFSWSRCDGCHSHVGGSRYRLAEWEPVN